MIEKNFVENIVNGIHEGLKTHSAKEVVDAVSSALTQKSEKIHSVEKVLALVCEEYNISKKALMSSSAARGAAQARKMAYCLLYVELKLSVYYIAKRIFFKWNNSVVVAIKHYNNLDERIKPDKEFKERFEKLKCKLANQNS